VVGKVVKVLHADLFDQLRIIQRDHGGAKIEKAHQFAEIPLEMLSHISTWNCCVVNYSLLTSAIVELG